MNVIFGTTPRLDIGEGDDEWVLATDFMVKVIHRGRSEWITVPAGFVTDLASVPRLPGAYMLFGGRARRSAILHDYLYRYARGHGKEYADSVFLEAMKAEGINWLTRKTMHLGVRLFGQAAYDKYAWPPIVLHDPERTP